MREYDIPAMLEKAEYVTGILRVAYALQEIEDYTKQSAVRDLMKILEERESTTFLYKVKK